MAAIEPRRPESSGGGPFARLRAAGARGWPEALGPQLAMMLVDQEMISRVERGAPGEIAAFQGARAGALIGHARRGSAFWRERLPPPQARATWSELPVLSREALREAAAAGPLPLPPERQPVREASTTGSSGVPLKLHVCAVAARVNASGYFHQDHVQGYADAEPSATISMIAVHEGAHTERTGHPLLGGARTYRRRVRPFTIEDHARWLSGLEVTQLVTTPTVLEGLLDVFEAGAARKPRLRLVGVHAETVPVGLRERVREVLGAPLLDRYSCEEAGSLAYECPAAHGRYHVAVANVLLEVLDPQGRAAQPGEVGRVVVTSLHNHAMPVVRYELGDLAAMDTGCPCGFQGPVLVQLLGRRRFLIRLPSGERRYVGTPAEPWLTIAPFRERRIVQTSPGEIQAEVVLDRPLAEAEAEAVVALLRREIGPEFSYRVVQVERIAWAPTYKRQDVVSLV